MMKLKGLEIGTYCTDNWQSFAEVLLSGRYWVGKQFTKKIEGVNTWFRTRLRMTGEKNDLLLKEAALSLVYDETRHRQAK